MASQLIPLSTPARRPPIVIHRGHSSSSRPCPQPQGPRPQPELPRTSCPPHRAATGDLHLSCRSANTAVPRPPHGGTPPRPCLEFLLPHRCGSGEEGGRGRRLHRFPRAPGMLHRAPDVNCVQAGEGVATDSPSRHRAQLRRPPPPLHCPFFRLPVEAARFTSPARRAPTRKNRPARERPWSRLVAGQPEVLRAGVLQDPTGTPECAVRSGSQCGSVAGVLQCGRTLILILSNTYGHTLVLILFALDRNSVW